MAMRTPHHFAWAGLLLGPAAWAVSTQLMYALVPWACVHGLDPLPWITIITAACALTGAMLSGWAWRRGEAEAVRFLAIIGAPLALLFALVIIMQGMAVGMVGCTR